MLEVESCIGRSGWSPATTRNAIALLQQRGAPDSVIESALKRVAALEHQRSRAISETA